MNVLQLSTHLNIGGITSYIVNLTKALKGKGHRVIVCTSGGDLVRELEKNNIAHITLDIKTKSELSPKIIAVIPKLLHLIRENNIQLIHSHTRVTQVLACILSRVAGVPYVTTCHGFFKLRLGRRFFKCWGDKTIAISDAVRDDLINKFGIDPHNVELVYNGIDISRFDKEFTKEEKDALKKKLGLSGKMVVGAIGRLSPVKGYSYLIDAFADIRKEREDISLLIVGDGPEAEELVNRTKELGLEGSVIFTDPTLDTSRILSIIDIFVSSSVQEGLGLSVAEALASRRPVVATDVGGVSSLIKNRHTGILVEAKDPRAISDAVLGLLKDPDLMRRLGGAGRILVEKDFGLDLMSHKVESIYNKIKNKNRQRILIINVNWLGDVLFTTPFIKAIKKKFPDSRIACLVVPRCKDLLETNPNIDEVIIYDEDGSHKSLLGKLRLISVIKKAKFDSAFILHRSFTRALLVYLSGIKKRIGYNTKRRGFLLTQSVKEPAKRLHKIEYFLNLAAVCGAPIDDKDYEFTVTDEERLQADKLLGEGGVKKDDHVVVLNPGGNWPPKRWSKENFAKLADRLSDDLGVKIVITGAPADVELSCGIIELSKSRPISIAGKTSLKSLGAVMKKADLVISSDSGPMHLALSVRTRVIALFGPTSDAITGPYGSGDFIVIRKDVDCSIPCYDHTCKDYRCMNAITVDDVIEEAKRAILEHCHYER